MRVEQQVGHEIHKPSELPTKGPKVYSNSRAHRLCNLEIGESVAEAKRIAISEASRDAIRDAATNIKGSLSRSISVASDRTGYTFKTESVQSLTQSGDVLVIQVVTRTA